MEARIDHARSAQDHIDWAHDQQAAEGSFEFSVRDNALIAQAHATLALAEQQRIANRIALAAHELQVHGRVMVTDHGILDNPQHVDGYLNVKPEITAALS